MTIKGILACVELRALCFVLAVAVASLAVIVVKKNAKIDAFRIDLAVAYERISKLETELEKKNTAKTVGDVKSALEEVSKKTASFEKEFTTLTTNLNNLLNETNALAKEEGGPFDALFNNVKNLVQRFTDDVPEIQENINTLATSVEEKASQKMEEIEQVFHPSVGGGVSSTIFEDAEKGALHNNINNN